MHLHTVERGHYAACYLCGHAQGTRLSANGAIAAWNGRIAAPDLALAVRIRERTAEHVARRDAIMLTLLPLLIGDKTVVPHPDASQEFWRGAGRAAYAAADLILQAREAS